MSIVPPYLNNTKFNKNSINVPLYSVSTDSSAFSEPPNIPNNPAVPNNPGILKPNSGVVQNAVLTGGRNSNPPILKDYLEARDPYTGVKVYGTPAQAEQAYLNALSRFGVEKSLEVVPLNGQKYLNHTRSVVSAEQATFDYAMIPTCGRLDRNSLNQECLPEKTILATISDMDANGNITSTDPIEVAPSSPETPGVAVLGTGKLYGINGYGGALAGTTSLPCVVVPQKDPSSCGQVFIENGFQNTAKESEYRNLAGILANPAMSTTSSSTNLQVQFQVPQLLVPYQAGAF
jgi:hypothetical protein